MVAMNQAKMNTMMQRDGSVDMNNQRPPTPGSGDNAPSPSKRPRIEGQQFNGQQMGPGGRTQGMQNPQMGATTTGPGPNPTMMMNGMTAGEMPAGQFNFPPNQMQQKGLEV
jgi:hypothetical protein